MLVEFEKRFSIVRGRKFCGECGLEFIFIFA